MVGYENFYAGNDTPCQIMDRSDFGRYHLSDLILMEQMDLEIEEGTTKKLNQT